MKFELTQKSLTMKVLLVLLLFGKFQLANSFVHKNSERTRRKEKIDNSHHSPLVQSSVTNAKSQRSIFRHDETRKFDDSHKTVRHNPRKLAGLISRNLSFQNHQNNRNAPKSQSSTNAAQKTNLISIIRGKYTRLLRSTKKSASKKIIIVKRRRIKLSKDSALKKFESKFGNEFELNWFRCRERQVRVEYVRHYSLEPEIVLRRTETFAGSVFKNDDLSDCDKYELDQAEADKHVQDDEDLLINDDNYMSAETSAN